MATASERGYTLIELVVTVLVAAVLAAIAAPSFTEAHRRQRLGELITDLANAHRLARSEAAARGRTVSVCKSADATSAAPSCGGDAVSWEDGWVVFENADADLPAAIDPGEPILRVAPALRPGLTLRGTAPIGAHVSYRPTGDVVASGTLVLCDGVDPHPSRALLVSTVGRVAVAERDAAGRPLDDGGDAIPSCDP